MPRIVAGHLADIVIQECTTDSQVREAICVGIRIARDAGYADEGLLISEVVAVLEKELAGASDEFRSGFLRRCISVIRHVEFDSTATLEHAENARE